MADAVSVMESENKQHKRHAEKIAAAKTKRLSKALVRYGFAQTFLYFRRKRSEDYFKLL
jgi:hypothetical protein